MEERPAATSGRICEFAKGRFVTAKIAKAQCGRMTTAEKAGWPFGVAFYRSQLSQELYYIGLGVLAIRGKFNVGDSRMLALLGREEVFLGWPILTFS